MSRKRNKNHPHKPKVAHNGPAQEGRLPKRGHVVVSGKIETEIPAHLVAKYDSTQTNTDTWEWRKFNVNLWTLGALFLTALLALWQGCSTKKAADAARDSVIKAEASSHLDQRAWVAVVQIDGIPELNKEWVMAIHARNTGKTFATDFHMIAEAEPVAKGVLPNFATDTAETDTTAVLPPGADYVVPIANKKAGIRINKAALNELTSGDIVEYAHGRLTYNDVFGCPHWTNYCFKLGTNLKWGGCKEHNSADDNSCQQNQQASRAAQWWDPF